MPSLGTALLMWARGGSSGIGGDIHHSAGGVRGNVVVAREAPPTQGGTKLDTSDATEAGEAAGFQRGVADSVLPI